MVRALPFEPMRRDQRGEADAHPWGRTVLCALTSKRLLDGPFDTVRTMIPQLMALIEHRAHKIRGKAVKSVQHLTSADAH